MSGLARTLSVLTAIAFGCTLGNAWADEGATMTKTSPAGTTGPEIYVHICQGCHMPQGEGAVGAGHYPSLARSDDLKGRLGQIVAAQVVLNGRNGMPAFGHSQRRNPLNDPTLLNDAQVAEIVNYVRSHFGNNFPERLTAAQVAALRHPVSAPSF
jgi:mono/diheme cytochrome c family protein